MGGLNKEAHAAGVEPATTHDLEQAAEHFIYAVDNLLDATGFRNNPLPYYSEHRFATPDSADCRSGCLPDQWKLEFISNEENPALRPHAMNLRISWENKGYHDYDISGRWNVEVRPATAGDTYPLTVDNYEIHFRYFKLKDEDSLGNINPSMNSKKFVLRQGAALLNGYASLFQPSCNGGRDFRWKEEVVCDPPPTGDF